jgi:hypothetical protein
VAIVIALEPQFYLSIAPTGRFFSRTANLAEHGLKPSTVAIGGPFGCLVFRGFVSFPRENPCPGRPVKKDPERPVSRASGNWLEFEALQLSLPF